MMNVALVPAPALDTVFRLPAKTTLVRLADECRSAAIDFLNDSPQWSRRQLTEWLTGPYADATAYVAHLFPSQGREKPSSEILGPGRGDPANTRALIDTTRKTLLEAIEVAMGPEGSATIAAWSLSHGLLLSCEDDEGNVGCAPIAREGAQLAERVASLLAADFLLRPEEFDAALAHCSRCDRVAFDPIARARGECRTHASGVFLRLVP